MTPYGNTELGSTLAQVMACCLTAPSHCLNHCWLLITAIRWYSSESNFTMSALATILYNELENYSVKIILTFTWSRWVKRLQEVVATFQNRPRSTTNLTKSHSSLISIFLVDILNIVFAQHNSRTVKTDEKPLIFSNEISLWNWVQWVNFMSRFDAPRTTMLKWMHKADWLVDQLTNHLYALNSTWATAKCPCINIATPHWSSKSPLCNKASASM